MPKNEYTDFIFVNRNGKTQHQGTLNKAIRRIIRDCNDEVLLKDENATVLLPHFTCHSLRHTFSTRMCEAGINVKVIQDTLGHQDISTTMNIYTDATKELKDQEFQSLNSFMKKAVGNFIGITPYATYAKTYAKQNSTYDKLGQLMESVIIQKRTNDRIGQDMEGYFRDVSEIPTMKSLDK